MSEVSFETRRGELKTYFDKTAADKWVTLTSNSPVSRIRETVRQGREQMRATLLEWLPQDLSGMRVLDAGCGTGMLAIEAARRGAEVVAIDISPSLIEEANKRKPEDLNGGSITFLAGDMSAPELGTFDYIVAMDSFIHYPLDSIVGLLEGMASRAKQGMLFTFAPSTPMLLGMKAAGQFFPKNDRSPAIEPVSERKLIRAIEASNVRRFGFSVERTRRIDTMFYKSSAMEIVNA